MAAAHCPELVLSNYPANDANQPGCASPQLDFPGTHRDQVKLPGKDCLERNALHYRYLPAILQCLGKSAKDRFPAAAVYTVSFHDNHYAGVLE